MKKRPQWTSLQRLAAGWVLLTLVVRVLAIPLILARALWNTLDAALRGDLRRHVPRIRAKD